MTLAGRELRIMLVKNPAGANEVLRTLALEPGEHDLLGVLNDNIADGRDVSWIWDADFETLADRVRRVTCSGTRAAELALRLKYAGVAPERIAVESRPRGGAGPRGGGSARSGRRGPLYALPTYTAMLSLRELLVSRGLVGARGYEQHRAGAAPTGCGGMARPRMRRLPGRPAAVARAGAAAPGPVLDIGAGTGRVALDLARAGHAVLAVDLRSACCSRSCAGARRACR